MEQMPQSNLVWMQGSGARGFQSLGLLLALMIGLSGCASKSQPPEQRDAAAKALFEQVTKDFHIPSANAKGAEREKLQNQAAAGYEQLLKKFPDQIHWAAQAERSLGNIRAAQGKLDDAVKHYTAVEKKYPQQEWEGLVALKSAADLLWEAGRRDEAKVFYGKVVARFDRPDASAVVKTIVRGSKTRLAGGHFPGEK